MQRLLAAFLLAVSALCAAHAEQLIPAGSVIECMVSEPHISSKTTHVGDPVLCQVSRVEKYGRSVFPYGSYMVGRFEDYRDPGHFVGKGWMELKFDRMVVGNDTVIPISTRVVATSGKNPVDSEGRIQGTGHAVKDTVEWMIPVLWPIDLLNLPRRGPRPELKAETRLTVKLLDDFGIPTKQEVQHQPELISRYNYADNTAQQQAPAYQPTPAPVQQAYTQAPAPIQQAYAQPSPTTVVVVQQPAQAAAPAPIIYNNYSNYSAPPTPVYVPYGYPPGPYWRYRAY